MFTNLWVETTVEIPGEGIRRTWLPVKVEVNVPRGQPRGGPVAPFGTTPIKGMSRSARETYDPWADEIAIEKGKRGARLNPERSWKSQRQTKWR